MKIAFEALINKTKIKKILILKNIKKYYIIIIWKHHISQKAEISKTQFQSQGIPQDGLRGNQIYGSPLQNGCSKKATLKKNLKRLYYRNLTLIKYRKSIKKMFLFAMRRIRKSATGAISRIGLKETLVKRWKNGSQKSHNTLYFKLRGRLSLGRLLLRWEMGGSIPPPVAKLNWWSK